MKITDKVINLIKSDVADKDLLEVACGRADLSIALSSLARSVNCIDLVDFRLDPDIINCKNVQFSVMDATSMAFDDDSFDTAVIYNAAYHVKEVFDKIVAECFRVVRGGGSVYVISSFSIDRAVIEDEIIPLLNGSGAQFTVQRDQKFITVRISAKSTSFC